MTDLHHCFSRRAWLVAGALVLRWPRPAPAPQTGDYIVAVVNQELVTAAKCSSGSRASATRRRAAARRCRRRDAAQQVLDALIDERVLVTNARESGIKIDEPEIDRAVANVAAQNQLTLAQLRERLRQEGIDVRASSATTSATRCWSSACASARW